MVLPGGLSLALVDRDKELADVASETVKALVITLNVPCTSSFTFLQTVVLDCEMGL